MVRGEGNNRIGAQKKIRRFILKIPQIDEQWLVSTAINSGVIEFHTIHIGTISHSQANTVGRNWIFGTTDLGFY